MNRILIVEDEDDTPEPQRLQRVLGRYWNAPGMIFMILKIFPIQTVPQWVSSMSLKKSYGGGLL